VSGFTLAIGGREIDVDRGLVRTSGTELALTTLQRELLQILVAEAGAVVPREEVLRRLWGGSRRKGATRPVDALVHQLRTILEDDPAAPRHLLTVRGQGYRLKLAPSRTNQTGALPPLPVPEETLSEILRACESAGWVLLAGPPGAGKTSLARHACRALASRLPGGAWWLDCRELSGPDALMVEVS
jgi:DNA-binding winged helix-turn-helix (wHTH) protein